MAKKKDKHSVGHSIDNVHPVKPAFKADKINKRVGESSISDNSWEFSEFALEALKVHNAHRDRHRVPELQLSQKLCKFSQKRADICAGTSRHSKLRDQVNNPYGENIFFVYARDIDFIFIPTARDVVNEWYNEIKHHIFGVEQVNENTLHFTQMIWKSSKELGIGVAHDDKGTYVVANYDPLGNYIGQFVENVPKPRNWTRNYYSTFA